MSSEASRRSAIATSMARGSLRDVEDCRPSALKS